MKHYQSPCSRLILLLALTALSSLTCLAQGFSPETVERLQQVLQHYQDNPANPYVGGMSASIKVDGLASWTGSTGYAARSVDAQNNLLPGGTAFTIETESRMYSVTKTFTAALVLELVREGAIRLEDPVSMYIPVAGINPGLNSSVTIRQLLVHESGYSDYSNEINLQIAVAFQPTHVWTAFEMMYFIHQLQPPGTERRYSSSNYIILGAIIEIATGVPVEQHFRQRFFTPLGLSSMYLAIRESAVSNAPLAAPHDNLSPFNPIFQLTGQPVFPNAYTNVSAFPFTGILSLAFTSGGITSNVDDMANWGNDLFGGRATTAGTLETMLNSISSTPDEDGDFLGYGIFRTTRISSTDIFIGHDGNAPGYRSVMFYQPERKMTIAILTNYSGARLYEVAKALYEALPEFICGNDNKKEKKIIACYNGNAVCVDRAAAATLIRKGAWLGGCEEASVTKPAGFKEAPLNNANKLLVVYPNPATDEFRVSINPNQNGKLLVSLYDVNGKKLATLFNKEVVKGVRQEIVQTTGRIGAGVYFIRVEGNGEVLSEKVVIGR